MKNGREPNDPLKGHGIRRNDAESEGIAQEFQQFGAKGLHQAFKKGDFKSGEGVPKDSVVALLAAHALAPTRGASQALVAIGRLADICGLKGSSGDHKSAVADVKKQLAKIAMAQETLEGRVHPPGPRPAALPNTASEAAG